MSTILHHSVAWAQPFAFTSIQLSAQSQSQSLTSCDLYSHASPPLKTQVLSPSVNSVASYYMGSADYSNDSSVLGGVGMAPGSQAQYSTAGSDSNSSRSPLERLGFKLHIGNSGEKKTRGQSTHPISTTSYLINFRWTSSKKERPQA
jgi:hypothetical protein